MYFLLDACQHPTILSVLYFAYLILEIVFVIVPIGLIVMLMIDFTKAVVINKEDEQIKSMKLVGKRIMYAVFIFATPWLVNFIMTIIGSVGVDIGEDYNICINNVRDIMSGTKDIAFFEKLQEDEESASQKEQESEQSTQSSQNIGFGDSVSGIGTTSGGEPSDPLTPIRNLYNATKYEIYNPDNFVAMKDKNNGQSLGAWPKTATGSDLSGNLVTYLNGNLIYPTSGDGSQSYTHNGIDIVGSFGTPIYAPADGTLRYSEWGRTVNKGVKETAYSASILLDNTNVSYTGTWRCDNGTSLQKTEKIQHIYLTHMVGIKYRTNKSGEIHVKKGDLIGFMGIANSCVHLHMTFYGESGCGVITGDIQKIYGLTGSKNAGK